MARAVAKKRRKKAAKAAASRPKAPRTEAQIAAARANMEKASAARKANQAARNAAAQSDAGAFVVHPADAAGQRPAAFFTLGGKKSKAEREQEKQARAERTQGKEQPHALSAFEAETFREKLFDILISLWELADKGLTATALDGAECDIWRSIDDADTSFLVDRIIAKGKENAYIGAQVRMLIDHWSDARMVAILGPRVLESAGWHQAHGLNVAFAGVNIQMPPKARRGRKASQNGHQAGAAGYGPTQPYSPTGEGAMYGAQ